MATYKYDVFGAVRSSSGGGSTEYRFTGQQDDATLGYGTCAVRESRHPKWKQAGRLFAQPAVFHLGDTILMELRVEIGAWRPRTPKGDS